MSVIFVWDRSSVVPGFQDPRALFSPIMLWKSIRNSAVILITYSEGMTFHLLAMSDVEFR